jgi:pre-mRNA-processing factor 19
MFKSSSATSSSYPLLSVFTITMSCLQDTNNTALHLDYTIVDVFTRQRYHGNPLAVVYVPNESRRRMTKDVKQRIAREFNLSETVFIHVPDFGSKSSANDTSIKSCHVDIFTVDEELPFAGHPIVGAACIVLDHLRWEIDALELKAGTFPIRRVRANDLDTLSGNVATPANLVHVSVAHDLHVHSRTLADVLAGANSPSTTRIAASLSSDEVIMQAELCAPVVSIVQGMTALLVKLPTLAHLARVSTATRLRFDEHIQNLLLDKGPWGSSFCYRYYYVDQAQDWKDEDSVSTLDKEDIATRHFRARMVELATEDPATGSAACTLGAYLAVKQLCQPGTTRFKIAQGIEMGRRSYIIVEAKSKTVDSAIALSELALCGTAVVVMEGSIRA